MKKFLLIAAAGVGIGALGGLIYDKVMRKFNTEELIEDDTATDNYVDSDIDIDSEVEEEEETEDIEDEVDDTEDDVNTDESIDITADEMEKFLLDYEETEDIEDEVDDPHYDPISLKEDLMYKITSAKCNYRIGKYGYPSASIEIDVNTRGNEPLVLDDEHPDDVDTVNNIITEVAINKLYHKDIVKYFVDNILSGYYTDICICIKTAVKSSSAEASDELYYTRFIESSYVQKALEKRFTKSKHLVCKMIESCTKRFFEEDLHYMSIIDDTNLVFIQKRYNDHMLFFNAMSLLNEKGFISKKEFDKTFDSALNEGIYHYISEFIKDTNNPTHKVCKGLSIGQGFKLVNINNKFNDGYIDSEVESYLISVNTELYKDIMK